MKSFRNMEMTKENPKLFSERTHSWLKNKWFMWGSLIVLTALGLFMMDSVSALTNISRVNPNSYPTSSGADTHEYGMVIIPQADIWLLNITASANADLPDGCNLRNGSQLGSAIIGNGTMFGNDCVLDFATPVPAFGNFSISWTGTYGADYNLTGILNQTVTDIRFTSAHWRGDGDSTQASRSFLKVGVMTSASGLSLVSPTNGTTIFDQNIIFNASINGDEDNATIYIWNSTGVFNQTTITSPSSKIGFNITGQGFSNWRGLYEWNVLACTSGTCNFATSNSTFFNTGFNENSQTFEGIALETDSETFDINISYSTTEFTSVAGTLHYKGTNYAGTSSGSNGEIILSRDIQIPLGAGTNSFVWQLALTNSSGTIYKNSTSQTQIVSPTILSICNSTISTPYLNFTFKDETNDNILNASTSLTDFDFWLGDGTVSKNYIFTNTTENPSYGFCFDPPDKDITVDLTFKYASSGFPIRTFQYDDQPLTNSTTSKVLYLLATADGIYSTIQVTTSLGSPISGVVLVVERQFNGVYQVVEQGVSGTDGGTTFWVNPNFDHRITATKAGLITAQAVIRPSQSTYTLIMGETTGNATYVSDLPGVKWVAYPHPGSIQIGAHNFNVTVTAADSNLENCKFELINAANTSQVLATSTSLTNSTYCQPSFDYTVVKDLNFFGRLSIDTTATDGFVIVDSDWKWVAFDLDKKAWRGISTFFTDLRDLSEFGEGNEADFSRYVFFFILLTILLSVFFHFSGFEISNPGVSILLIWFIILVASIGGFLTFNSGSDNINAVWEQYAFLLIFSLLSSGFMFNRWRKDNE